MELSRLGQFIELVDERNKRNEFGTEDVKGISTAKKFIDTKANLANANLGNYKIVRKRNFAYVPDTSRRGDKIGLAFCDDKECLVSSIYTTFRINDETKLLPEYLMMFFKRAEFDRYTRFNSWGSARETFTWDDMCDTLIYIPKIEIQQKYVNIYTSLLRNLHVYENGLDDMKLTADALFDKIKRNNNILLNDLLIFENIRNRDFICSREFLRGINENGEFITTRDSVKDSNLDNYLLIEPNSFAVNFMCLGNFGKFYLAYNNDKNNYIVSPACQRFKIRNACIDPTYLVYVLKRSEFQRRCVFLGDGNTRGGINSNDFLSIKIPVPSLTIQKCIAKLFYSYDSRRIIKNKISNIIANICPILINGSIEESKKELRGK